MVLIRDKTLAILLLATIFTLVFVGTAAAAGRDSTATPTTGLNITPTPNATATPVPTPAPRQVFSSPNWNTDHETIVVKNIGGPITVVAWISDPSNNLKYEIDAGATKTISTPSILTQDGQIVDLGFNALENGTSIDSYNATITVSLGPTPTALPPESVTIEGTIVDADNSSSFIAGATVMFRSVSYEKAYPPVSTDSYGYFKSPKMYPDVYTITISASGYQSTSLTTNGKITGDATAAPIQLKKLAGAATPTPSPSPTSNLVDSWVSLLYSPGVCLGSLSALIAVVAGSIGIYEWFERKRKDRIKEEKGGEKKDEGPPAGIKKL